LLLTAESGFSTLCSLKFSLRFRTNTDLAATFGFSFDASPATQPTNIKTTINVKITSERSDAKKILKKLFML
jgi:hypothetical protein